MIHTGAGIFGIMFRGLRNRFLSIKTGALQSIAKNNQKTTEKSHSAVGANLLGLFRDSQAMH